MWRRIKEKYLQFLLNQSMQNILYVLILVLTLFVAGFVGIFVTRNQQEAQKQIMIENNQELAEQINISMSQYVHSMI